MSRKKHVILIGYKGVGKSTLGKRLAKQIGWLFFDLDAELEREYAKRYGKKISFREIMQERGEKFFRQLETRVLKQVLRKPASVIALWGGTIFAAANRKMIKIHRVVHIRTPLNKLLPRVAADGRPAFLHGEKDWKKAFIRQAQTWQQKGRELADTEINNSGTLKTALQAIRRKLEI